MSVLHIISKAVLVREVSFTLQMKTIFKKYTEKIMDPNIENVNHRTCWMSVQKEVTEGRSLVCSLMKHLFDTNTL